MDGMSCTSLLARRCRIETKDSALRDLEVVKVVEPVLPQSSLPDEVTGALFLDAAPITAERDGEALLHELAHGDNGAGRPEGTDQADVVQCEVRSDYGAHGGDGMVLPGARGEPSVGSLLRRPRIGEQVRAARSVHVGSGVEDETGAAAFGFLGRATLGFLRCWIRNAASLGPFCSPLKAPVKSIYHQFFAT